MSLPSASSICQLPRSIQISSLNELFEPCPTLTSYIIPRVFQADSIYDSYTQIVESIRSHLMVLRSQYQTNPTPDLKRIIDAIVGAHPRLGAPKQVLLSTNSQSEQNSLNGGDPNLTKKLTQLNDLYESTFPGLRYVVFVNGRSREVIMRNMKMRIQRHDFLAEVVEAFNAMCDIALDRARKLGAKM
ncbi:hypothetical protein FOA43_000188 [Brettanomyces nanus]|uniref:Oxo-4-hydroxy-4-carboxy-5-ureidoimidazoline decarboxylase domain-containing protein n=1 Tax=Eeniella nana TaxID=13502 RepID=A0A875RXY0_EENNA|nr:uncharacterized protein FOA43_000188 [Brettanomyces nanus]QPG72885.1 hypothetical protein FOA43_000188 [Brettanomyces nanus]